MAAASRWFLRWLLESARKGDDDDHTEWERQNDFLIPAASKETPAPSVHCASSPHRTACVPIHASSSRTSPSKGCHTSYGRFGKSCPPGLEPPIERHDEEEEAQEDFSGRGLKRAHSTTTVDSLCKWRSIDCAAPQQTSDTIAAWRYPASPTGFNHDRLISPFSSIPASKPTQSGIQQQLWQQQQQLKPQQQSLQQQGHGNCPSARSRSGPPFQQPIVSQPGSSASDALCQTNNLGQADSTLGLQPSDSQSTLATCSTHSLALDVLLDESVQDLGGSTLMLNSAPVLTIGRAATMDALHSSLSDAFLHTMVLDEPVKTEQLVFAPRLYRSSVEVIDVVPVVHDSIIRRCTRG